MNKNITKINLIRFISCVAILLYHLGLLKGGYLAVCTFFVLTGYLGVISNYPKKDFNLKSYYLKRLKKIYLPLIITVFTTLTVLSFLKNITYLNYKKEIISILFGYNNFWQLNAQLDYFTRFVSSPFMHLWYIAIILQYELVFPIILIGIKKISTKVSKILPYIILLIIGVGSYYIFYKITKNNQIMNAYYSTLTRLFSIVFGMIIGLFHTKYKPVIIRNKFINNIVFYLYIIVLIVFFILFGIKSKYYPISMLLVTLISLRLLDYSKNTSNEETPFSKIIGFVSQISYEIYLVQYPVIFIFQNIKSWIKIPLIIIITVIISVLINYILNKKKKINILKILLIIIFSITTIFGFYTFITSKDNTKEMKKLEEDLKQNQKIIEKRQKEFAEKKKNEETRWEDTLKSLELDEKQLENKVRNMSIIGIGDSVMELAVNDLIKEFPNGYFDAKTNRRPSQVNDILIDLKNRNLLGDVLLFNIGTNGEFYPIYTDAIMETLGNRKVFWVNATNADYDDFNDRLKTLAEKYSNIRIIDWVSVAKAHPEYLISDKVHPTVYGCKIYANTLFTAIYEEFKKELNEQKEAKLLEHNKEEEEKITFIGNDLLLGLYDSLVNDYQNSDFIIDSDFNYNSLKKKLKEEEINHNIVFLFDTKMNITDEEYSRLLKEYPNNKIIIIDITNSLKIENDNVKVINIRDKLKKDSFRVDGIHLTDKGNNILKNIIKENLK